MTFSGKTWALAGALFVSTGVAIAQTAEPPRLGFVIDRETKKLHSVEGVPGAAVVLPAITLAGGVSARATASDGGYVAVVAGDGYPAIWRAGVALLRFPEANLQPDAIFLSPEGKSAALVYGNAVLTFSGLPETPSLTAKMMLTVGKSALAVSDDGRFLLWADGNSVAVASAGGIVNRVKLATPVTAVAFASASHDGAAAGTSEAYLIRNVENPDAIKALPAEGLGTILGVVFTPDGRRLILNGPEVSQVAMIALEDAPLLTSVVKCDCVPTGFARLGGTAAYRITEYAAGVAWIFDASTANPRFLSVSTVINPEK